MQYELRLPITDVAIGEDRVVIGNYRLYNALLHDRENVLAAFQKISPGVTLERLSFDPFGRLVIHDQPFAAAIHSHLVHVNSEDGKVVDSQERGFFSKLVQVFALGLVLNGEPDEIPDDQYLYPPETPYVSYGNDAGGSSGNDGGGSSGSGGGDE